RSTHVHTWSPLCTCAKRCVTAEHSGVPGTSMCSRVEDMRHLRQTLAKDGSHQQCCDLITQCWALGAEVPAATTTSNSELCCLLNVSEQRMLRCDIQEIRVGRKRELSRSSELRAYEECHSLGARSDAIRAEVRNTA